MASPSELSLECKPSGYSMLLKSFGDQNDQTQKLEDVLSCLEEERLKIDAFKRELPLCMQLLNNAVEASRQQLEQFQISQGSKPVLEEFIPLKYPNSDESDHKASNMSEKANWMTSAQLWSPNQGGKHEADMEPSLGICPNLALENKPRNGGAFHPFSKDRTTSPVRALPELALASSDKELDEKKCSEQDQRIACNKGAIVEQGKGGAISSADAQGTQTTATTQAHRKARRCWSPDLHRRFVNALQILGGSQVATPKQIRELMKVDGLTNDEVKSHLQKYRLHTRRPSPGAQASTAPTPQLVVLGGIWVPQEYATAAAHGGPGGLYGAHPATHAAATHYCTPQVAQDFYPHMRHPNIHHPPLQQHTYKASSQMHSSPESDGRGAGGRSESIEEDGKSDCSSWKGDSGNNEGGGGAKGLLPLRDQDGEVSNGSEITLKF